MEITNHETPIFVTGKYAKLNKNNTLAEYISECAKEQQEPFFDGYETIQFTNWYNERTQIASTVTLTNTEYQEFINNLLDDREWLSGKGGTDSSYELSPEDEADPMWFYRASHEEKTSWLAESFEVVIKVVNGDNPAEKILVNPQGYKYARYVAFIC